MLVPLEINVTCNNKIFKKIKIKSKTITGTTTNLHEILLLDKAPIITNIVSYD